MHNQYIAGIDSSPDGKSPYDSFLQRPHGYDMICIFDESGLVEHVAGTGWLSAGLLADEVLAMPIGEIFYFDTVFLQHKSVQPFKLESQRQTEDGTLFLEHVILPVIHNGTFYCMTKNITEEKKVLRQLKEKVAQLSTRVTQLEARDTNKNKILSVLSHDLRNPISAISTLATMIESGDIETDLKQSVHEMKDKLSVANDFISGMLEWASKSFSGIVSSPVDFDFSILSDKCIYQLKHQAEQKNIIITNNITVPFMITGYADQLNITLRNLLQNAIKFTSPGGAITIDGRNEEQQTIITVADTGIGMEEEQLSRIFSKPLTTAGTDGEKGFGMGLIMCKEYIENNGGTLQINSREGEGTTVTISLLRTFFTHNS